MRNLACFVLLSMLSISLSRAGELSGKWTYRSYHNRPNVIVSDDDHAAEKALSLLFGEGVFTLTQEGDDLTGVFDMGGGYVLDVRGKAKPAAAGAPVSLEFVGTGRAGTPTANWEYDYVGYLVPTWPNGVKQVPAFVGTVLRGRPHGNSAAGYTASFIAVKQPAPVN
jgi:hypothetical protein